MVPDIETRIQSCLRALSEVVIPNLPETEEMAREQAHLVVKHLELLAAQVEGLHGYHLADVRSSLTLLDELASQTGDPVEVEPAVRAYLDQPVHLTTAELAATAAQLKERASGILAGLVEVDDDSSIDAIKRYASRQTELERDWVRASGLVPFFA